MSSDLDELFFGVGRRWREERERLGLNQKELAGLLATSSRTIIDYESGSSPPKLPKLMLFWQHGGDIQYILTGDRGLMKNQEANTPAARLADQVFGLTLTQDDADLLLSMAQRLAVKR